MNKPMIVKLYVEVEAAERSPQFIDAETMLESESIEMVSRAIDQFGAVKRLKVEVLGDEHCGFMGEIGIPYNVDLEHYATVYSCGSWSYPHGIAFNDPKRKSGDNIGSLVAFVIDAHRRNAWRAIWKAGGK